VQISPSFRRVRVVIAIAIFIACGTASSAAQSPPARAPHDDSTSGVPARGNTAGDSARVLTLSRRLMSPFCPGRTLASCSSQSAAEWLADVRVWVAEGATDEEITGRLQSRTPEFDLSADPGGSWDWGIGVLAIGNVTLLLGAIAYSTTRRGRADQNVPADSAARAPDGQERLDLEDRLDEELALVD
jgi:cytochrome c-type biogenesis protein CcmH/NrfF